MNSNKIQIYINGKKKLVNNNKNLLELLKSTNINGNFFAVELNKEVIPKSLYSSKEIKEGDKIEIVHFIGGG
tara:strand:+ start:33 stop:248 length:216 start_codon:yes stop_codon:yes gene_type:complete